MKSAMRLFCISKTLSGTKSEEESFLVDWDLVVAISIEKETRETVDCENQVSDNYLLPRFTCFESLYVAIVIMLSIKKDNETRGTNFRSNISTTQSF